MSDFTLTVLIILVSHPISAMAYGTFSTRALPGMHAAAAGAGAGAGAAAMAVAPFVAVATSI